MAAAAVTAGVGADIDKFEAFCGGFLVVIVVAAVVAAVEVELDIRLRPEPTTLRSPRMVTAQSMRKLIWALGKRMELRMTAAMRAPSIGGTETTLLLPWMDVEALMTRDNVGPSSRSLSSSPSDGSDERDEYAGGCCGGVGFEAWGREARNVCNVG